MHVAFTDFIPRNFVVDLVAQWICVVLRWSNDVGFSRYIFAQFDAFGINIGHCGQDSLWRGGQENMKERRLSGLFLLWTIPMVFHIGDGSVFSGQCLSTCLSTHVSRGLV